MNNSLHRMIDGMVATLRAEVIPQIGSDYARGQAYGLIYMLNSIRLRAEWSAGYFREQLAAQLELRAALLPLLASLDAPALPEAADAALDSAALEALRDANEGRICALIDWRAEHSATLDASVARTIDTALQACMERQLRHELKTSAKPMFAEMSSGTE